jgi:acetyl/propionyl-CoA carboxylase alpha subunit
MEVRLYAEDAEAGFLPATGRVDAIHWPTGDGIRVDAGVAVGDEVTGRFDPMLAKIAALGANRAEALQRLTEALDETVVLGLTTNLRFLRWLVRQPAVRRGQARIDTLDAIWSPAPDEGRSPDRIPMDAWTVAARALDAGGWRLNAFFATFKHEVSNSDTAARIRRSLRERFKTRGVVQFTLYGYVKPPGAKTDADVRKDPAAEPVQRVTDYLAGMTDRFCLSTYERLAGPNRLD